MVYRRPRRNRSYRGRRGYPRSRTAWVRNFNSINFELPNLPNGVGTCELLSTEVIDVGAVTGATILRVRGTLRWTTTASSEANTGLTHTVIVGALLMPRGGDGSDYPSPDGEPNGPDWFYYRSLPLAGSPYWKLGADPSVLYGHAFELDIKAKRIMTEANQTPFLIVYADYPVHPIMNFRSSVLVKYA